MIIVQDANLGLFRKAILLFAVLLTFMLLIVSIKAETTFFDQDDSFIIGSSTTEGITEGASGTSSGESCGYKWGCTSWSECLPSGKQTRNCTNIGTCSSTYKTPETGKTCIYAVKEVGKVEKVEKETGKISGKEIIGNDYSKILSYFIIIVIIGFVILYLKKNYFKK